MNITEKSRFIAQSLKSVYDRRYKIFKKFSRKKIETIISGLNKDYNDALMDRIGDMVNVAVDAIAAVCKWESEALKELDGLTPEQYYYSLDKAEELIELVSLLEKDALSTFALGLMERILKLRDSDISREILQHLESMQMDDSKCLTNEQKAVVRIAWVFALPEYLEPLIRLAGALDNEKSDQSTIKLVFDALGKLGGIAVEPLAELLEKYEKKGQLYETLIVTLASTASEHKSERVYRLLKDCFRKSESKLVESLALAKYGDGRAVSAIRGHVEKNMDSITEHDFSRFESAVMDLGGDMSDLAMHLFGHYAMD
jgi:hypothetical protein